MSKQRAVGFGLRAALLGAALVAACSAGGDSEKINSVEEALTLAVPSRVRAVDFTAFNDSNTQHEGNCGSGPVDQQTVSDNGVTCGVAYTKPGEWLEYSLQVATAGKFHLVSRVAGNAAGKTFRLSIDGAAVGSSQSVPSAGWATFADRTLADVALTAGTHTLRILFETGDTNFNYIDVTPGSAALPQRLEAENYQRANESTPASNSGTGCNRGDGVDMGSTSDMAGNCLVGWATAGEWLEYDVTVAQPGLFDFSARLASATAGRQLQLSVDGAVVGTVTAPNTGYNAFEDRKLQNVNLSAGPHVVRATFVQGDMNLNFVDVSLHPVVPGYSFGGTVNFNAFVFQDLSLAPSVAGPVAAGRDVLGQNFSYNTTAAGTMGVLAGRSFNAASGNIQRDAVYGTSASLNQVTVAQGTSRKASPVDFVAEKATIDLLSTNLASLTATGTTAISPSGTIFTFTGTDPSRNVFSVNGALLAVADQFNFSVPATSTVIVNVTGTGAVFESASVQLGALTPGHLLWNFPQATTVRVTSVGFKGTLLASNAAVTLGSASLDGVLLAGSAIGANTGIAWLPFNGSLAVCSAAALSIAPGSPQLVGASPVLTASAACADNRAAEFHYDYLNSPTETSWHEVAPGFATTPVDWNTSALPAGQYQVRVSTRRVGEALLSGASATSSFILDNPVVIPIVAPTVETFASLGTTAVSAQPSGWRIDKQINPRTVGTFAAATFKTDFRAGALLSANSGNGIYNFGAGAASTQASNYWLNSTDRAPGWLSTGSTLATGGTKSGNLYVALRAPADQDLNGLDISYDIEKYMGGTNAAGFRVQLYSSVDGANWTSAGNDFLRSFSSHATNLGFDPAPGQTLNAATTKLAANIPRNSPFYLAWNYTIDSATSNDGSNAQALAIDNVSIQGSSGVCIPNCSGKVCGDDLSDGCGQTCPGACGGGQEGCLGNADCEPGLICGGFATGSTSPTICTEPICVSNPRIGGCGFAGAPCGSSCTRNPTCSSNTDCPSGYVCGIGNGYRYGVPEQNVCQLPGCDTSPQLLGCGTTQAQCGLCACSPHCENKHCGDLDLSDGCGNICPSTCVDGDPSGCGGDVDCRPGSYCAFGQGARLGLPASSNVCLPVVCATPDISGSKCGTLLSPCGVCPPQLGSCAGRECGSDPVSGASCGGTCADGRFCTASGTCIVSTPTPPILVGNGSGGSRPVVPPTSPPASGFGATPGNFAVTEQGSATYSIPIAIPPGRHGIEPALAVRYTSSTSNGTLGVGWSLDGLSTISLCQRTYAQDGQSRPVDLSFGEALCLDGQRLVSVADGTYRTENDTFTKIAGYDNAGEQGHPFGFTAFAKDGHILRYEAIANAKGNGQQFLFRTWALSSVEDRNGNFMRIVYRQTTSTDSQDSKWPNSSTELVPDSITYTGSGTTQGDREVKFEYSDSRPDKLLGYQIGGGILARTLRLEHIQVLASHSLVRRYDFSYETAPNNASRLTSIQECAGPSSICKGATQFKYKSEQGFDNGVQFTPAIVEPNLNSGAPPFFAPYGTALRTLEGYEVLTTESNNATAIPTTPIPGGADMAVQVIPVAGQIAGAIISLINLFGASSYQQNWFVRVFNDFEKHKFSFGGRCNPRERATEHVIRSSSGTDGLWDTCAGERQAWFIDVDGDGVQDRLQCSGDQKKVEYYLAKNHQHQVPKDLSQLPIPDGNTEAVTWLCASQVAWAEWATNHPALRGPEPPKPPFIAGFDVDGDGTGNLIIKDNTGFVALFFDGNTPEWRRLSTDVLSIDLEQRYVAFLDANGDGLRDVLALPSKQTPEFQVPVLWLNTGVGFRQTFLEVETVADGMSPVLSAAYVVDYDHDGVDDLIESPPANGSMAQPWFIRHFNNGRVTKQVLPEPGPVYPGALGDFDGDGNLDLVTRQPGTYNYFMHHGSGRLQNALQTIIDGFDRRLDIQYDRINAEGDHTYTPMGITYPSDTHVLSDNGTICNWPNTCPRKLDHILVSSYQESHRETAGAFIEDTDTRLSYHAEIDDAAGHGRLGFESRLTTVRDVAGSLITQTYLTNVVISSSTPQTPIETPYRRTLVGLPSEVTVTAPHAASALAPPGLTDNFQSTRTVFTWVEQTSASGRPFAILQAKHVKFSEVAPQGFTTAKSLFEKHEQFTVDGFGNTTDHIVTAQDFDPLGSLFPTPVPGSTSSYHVHRTFSPTDDEIYGWQISLLKAEDVTDQPRCHGGATSCASESRSQHADLTYYPSGDLYTVMRAPGEPTAQVQTTLGRDVYGNVNQVVELAADGSLRTMDSAFDDRGMFPISTTNRLGQTTQFRYDDRFGKLTARVDANEIAETWSYDDFGILRNHQGPGGEEKTDYEPDGATSTYGFAVMGKYRIRKQKVGGGTSVERYNSLGQLVAREISGLNGATVIEEFAYDKRDRLAISSRPHLPNDYSQGLVTFGYDDLDRVTTQTMPNGSVNHRDYALLSSISDEVAALVPSIPGIMSVARSTDAKLNATYQFLDREDRPLAMTDANLRTTAYAYGAFGSLEKIIAPSGTLSYEFDNYGRMRSAMDPALGGQRTLSYNGLDELVTSRDPAGRLNTIFYDELGRQKRLENTDGTTSWTYDDGLNAIGRLSGTLSPSGQQSSYAYEPPTGQVNRGLLASVTQSLVSPGASASTPPTVLTTSYRYDQFSRLEQIDYPGDGTAALSVKYGFDSAGHVTSVSDAADPNNVYWQLTGAHQGHRPSQETFGNGVSTKRQYEELTGYLSSIITKHGSTAIQQLGYGYDANGNLNLRADGLTGLSETIGYDALNRVSSTTYSNGQSPETFGYDPVSNALSHRDHVGAYTYYPNGRDWVKTAGDTQYTHDALGNIQLRSGLSVPGVGQEFTYTTFDLPSHVSFQNNPGGGSDFAYDSNGARVIKQTTDKTTFYANDLYQRTVSSVGAGGTGHRFMIYAGGRAIAAVSQPQASGPGAIQYLHDDSLGSVRTTTASDASVLETRNFDTFGDARGSLASSTQMPYGYTGLEQDSELGLVNMHGRLYDPALGQFMSADPLIQSPFGQGLNRFAYAFNSPLNYTDPSGYSAEANEAAAIGIGVGYFGGLAATLLTSGGAVGAAVGGTSAAAAAGGGSAAAGAGVIGAVPALAAAGVGAGMASSIAVNVYLTGRQAVRTSVSAMPTTRSATAAGNGPTTIGRSSYGTMATCPVTERPPGLSLFDPDAGAMACDGTPQQCAEIVRQNIEAIREGEWELFWAYTGGQAAKAARWGWSGFKAWRAARAASAAARAAPKLFSAAETQGLKTLFGSGRKGAEEALKRVSQGARDLPAGVTRETLQRYEQQIIEKNLKEIPVQSERLRIIQELLK